MEVRVPRELLWDYREAPEDALWRLQRIAEWFPAYGRDRETVRQLYEHRAQLRVPDETRALIELYQERAFVQASASVEPASPTSRRTSRTCTA